MATNPVQDVSDVMDGYYVWLRKKTTLRQVGQWVEITTPYLNRHNDYVQIYAKRSNAGFVLTDDGYTITDLEQVGCKFESRKRNFLLKMALLSFGVQLNGKELQIRATANKFGLHKNNLTQAILAVNNLFYLLDHDL